jgi:hypothetical protein
MSFKSQTTEQQRKERTDAEHLELCLALKHCFERFQSDLYDVPEPFNQRRLKEGISTDQFLAVVKAAGQKCLDHFFRPDSGRLIFFTPNIYCVMRSETAIDDESLLLHCRLYTEHNVYHKMSRLFLRTIRPVGMLNPQELEDAYDIAVKMVGHFQLEKVVFLTRLEHPFLVPAETLRQFLIAESAPRTVVFQQMKFTDEQLGALRSFRENLEFDDCYGTIESFIVGENTPQAAHLMLSSSFGAHAVQQIIRSLDHFECLRELTVGRSRGQSSTSYYNLNLDANCAQSIIAASAFNLQVLMFQSCDFDDVSWQNLCHGVANSKSTLERLVFENLSVPGWRETPNNVGPVERTNKKIERTHQMLDAFKKSRTRLSLEIVSNDNDAFDANFWKASSGANTTEKKANAIVYDTSIKRMSFDVDDLEDDSWKLLCDGVARSTSLQYLSLCYSHGYIGARNEEGTERMNRRTLQFIEAMKINTSLINVDFSKCFRPYFAKHIWDEHTPVIFQRNKIISIANAPVGIRGALLTRCANMDIFKGNDSFTFIALLELVDSRDYLMKPKIEQLLS